MAGTAEPELGTAQPQLVKLYYFIALFVMNHSRFIQTIEEIEITVKDFYLGIMQNRYVVSLKKIFPFSSIYTVFKSLYSIENFLRFRSFISYIVALVMGIKI